MLRFFSYLMVSFLLVCNLKAESHGTPFLTNFIYSERSHNLIWSIDQTHSGTILLAKRTGLLEFDSEDWSSIETPDIPLKIKTSDLDKFIFVAGRNFAGYLSLENTGKYKYNTLDTSNANYLYTDIIETNTDLYFYSSTCILQINSSTQKSKYHLIKDNANKALGVFSFKGNIYINQLDSGVSRLEDSGYVFLETPGFILNSEISFHCSYDAENIILGTSKGELFLFNGINFTPYLIEDTEFITSGILTDGISANSDLLALSTKNFGVILIHKTDGKTVSIINQDAGLPTNHISSLLVDDIDGLWLAHTKGLSRVSIKLPVSNYSSYAGLDASVNSVYYWNETLFLATSNGVYTLDTINLYDHKEIVSKIPIKTYPRINFNKDEEEPSIVLTKENKPAGSEEENESEADQTAKKGFLQKLFGKKKEDEAASWIAKNPSTIIEDEKEKDEEIQPPLIKKKQRYQTFTYETFVLKSKSYGFSNFNNITNRCRSFIPFQNQLLAITDAGIYSIYQESGNNGTTKMVTEVFSSSYIYLVLPSSNNENIIYVISDEGIYFGEFKNDQWNFSLQNRSDKNFKITSLLELSEKTFLLALNNQLVYYSIDNETIRTVELSNPYSERINLKSVGKNNYVIVGNDLYRVSISNIEDIQLIKEKNTSVIVPYLNQQNSFWVKGKEREFHYFGNDSVSKVALSFLRIFENITDIHVDENQNLWIVDNFESIYKINSNEFKQFNTNPVVAIKSVKTNKGTWVPLDNIDLNFFENALSIRVISPTYLQFNSNQYQYNIIGLTDKWTEWSNDNIINLPYIPAGKYTFKVRARDVLGNTSSVKSMDFKVSPPFWKTYYFYLAIAVIIAIMLHLIQQYRMKKLVKEKQVLGQKVKERTHELELKNKAITDSINYASKMQSGLLPASEVIKTYLFDFFIFLKPRDIVSGDFYWATQKNQYTVIAAADCTGHGVPGAFMSMLGMAYMSEIVGKAKITTASQILETLRHRIIDILSQQNSESRDGMDIALLVFDKQNNSLQYSGAHNPLYRLVSKRNKLSDEEINHISKENDKYYLLHYKANRFHVGKSNFSHVKFINHTITYYNDDKFYIFSDGYADQFGGKDERKFMYGPFKDLFLAIADKPMKEQEAILEGTVKEWMRGYEQTDDMMIFGIHP